MASASLNYNETNWSNIFYYCEDSPSFLRWKCSPHGNIKIGSPAGYFKKDSGWVIRFDGINYISHRIIYILHYGYLPNDLLIDHIDGDRNNNKLENLRPVTELINARNKKRNSRNTSGFVGVRKEINRSGTIVYRASWFDNGVLKSKAFNTNKFGHVAFQMAIDYRLEMTKNLEYTDRHLHGW